MHMNDEWVQELYKKYGKHVLQYLSHHTSNIEDAEDILQEILLSNHKSRAKFDESKCNEEAWLFILARNRLKNYYRDKKNTASLDAMEAVSIPTGEDPIEQALYLMDCREQVAVALQALDDRSRKVIVLRFFDNRTPTQIAAILGIEEGNVRVIQNRALKKLRSLMLEMEEPERRFMRTYL